MNTVANLSDCPRLDLYELHDGLCLALSAVLTLASAGEEPPLPLERASAGLRALGTILDSVQDQIRKLNGVESVPSKADGIIAEYKALSAAHGLAGRSHKPEAA